MSRCPAPPRYGYAPAPDSAGCPCLPSWHSLRLAQEFTYPAIHWIAVGYVHCPAPPLVCTDASLRQINIVLQYRLQVVLRYSRLLRRSPERPPVNGPLPNRLVDPSSDHRGPQETANQSYKSLYGTRAHCIPPGTRKGGHRDPRGRLPRRRCQDLHRSVSPSGSASPSRSQSP